MNSTIRGVYILKTFLRKDMEIRIGALGPLFFRKGFYAYTGSAMGGLEARIRRHLRSSKRMHWHIDYLLQKTKNAEFCIKETCSKEDECGGATVLMRDGGVPIMDFGSSDCRCKSHLLYFEKPFKFPVLGYRQANI